MDKNQFIKNWINLGIICGLLVSTVYPSLQFVSDLTIGLILTVLMGILLSLASTGLYFFIRIHKKSVSSVIGLFSNIISGVLVIQMFLVQLAIKTSQPEFIDETVKWIWNSVNHIHYGLDVAWDVYIFLGTFMFAISCYRHPKLGKIFSITGIIISSAMIITNITSFPIPPESGGFIDFGPLIGLWYLAITIKILFSKRWITHQLENR